MTATRRATGGAHDNVQREAVTAVGAQRSSIVERYQSVLRRYLAAAAGSGGALTDPPAGAAEPTGQAPVRHPAPPGPHGRGRRVTRVADVMSVSVVCAHEEAVFKEIVDALVRNGVAAVPVIDAQRVVVGMISGADLLSRLAAEDIPWTDVRRAPARRDLRRKVDAVTAKELMTSPPVTTTASTSIVDAARLVARRRVRHLPVVDDEGRLAGMVSRSDLLKFFLRSDEDLRAEIVRDVVVGRMALDPLSIEVVVDEGAVLLTAPGLSRPVLETLTAEVREVPGVVAVSGDSTRRGGLT